MPAACSFVVAFVVCVLVTGSGGAGQPEDMTVISSLLQNRAQIQRSVLETADGAMTHTHSSNPTVAAWIQEHVQAMKTRVATNNRIHQKDPFFVSFFDHRAAMSITYINVTDGVRVNDTGTTLCAVDLVHVHAKVVTLFIANGQEETQKEHDVPATCPQINGGMAQYDASLVPVVASLFSFTFASMNGL